MPLSLFVLRRLSFSDYLRAIVLNFPNSAPADSGIFTLASGPIDLSDAYCVTDTLAEEYFMPVTTCYGDGIGTYVIRRLRRACRTLRHRYRLSPLTSDAGTLEILSERVAKGFRPCRPADLNGILALSIIGKVYGALCETPEFGAYAGGGSDSTFGTLSIPLRFRSLGIEL